MIDVPDDLPSPESDEPPHQSPKRGWGCGQWFLAGLLAFLAFGWFVAVFNGLGKNVHLIQGVNNCRQIIISLKSYAGDHGGKYPGGDTANDALRQLIKERLLEDEGVFSAPISPYRGDNNLGEAPNYGEALKARENHWALTKGLTDASDGNCPVVFENPALASWPPRWDGRLVDVARPGRVVMKNRIIVGRNDSSVNWEILTRGDNPLITLRPIKDGKNIFELAGPHEVLDVAR